ncbi:hypothetical protein BDW22DRAFT_716198 [Trametopsis cervina]|nr:hypothetical protein BDW22DRAFT_716198 [Trametopsis cervina]
MILPESKADILSLTLTRDNPSNTTLVSQEGVTLYVVVSEHTKKAMVTTVRDAHEKVVASLEWREVLPDKVVYGDKKAISMGDWMKRSLIPFKDDVTFTDDEGRKYKWKGNSAGRSFELYSADDNYASTIARFYRSRRIPVTPPSDPTEGFASTPTLVNTPTTAPARLDLTPRAVQIQDLVVTSFLFLEKTRQINETESQSRADVLGTPALNVKGTAISNGGV